MTEKIPERMPEQRTSEPHPERKPEKPIKQRQVVMLQGPGQLQTQTIAIIGLVLVVSLIIGSLYLAQATATATTGQQLVQLQTTRDYLQRENEEMDAQIAEKRNVSTLRGRAQALGFVPVESERLDYMVVPGYESVRATATPEFTPEPTFVYDETFNGWAKQQWNSLAKQFEAWMSRNATPAPTP